MTVLLSPVGGVASQFFDNNGNPLTGGKIYTYAAGTTTPQATYTTIGGTVAHSNPIILDAGGRVPSGEIWLTDGIAYKFALKSATDVLIGTYDNLTGINSNFVNFLATEEIQTAIASQTVFTLATTSYQPGTNSLSVFVDGVNQYDGSSYAYVETNSTTVTFTAGLHVGALVKFTTVQTQSAGATDASQVSYTPAGTGAVATTVQAKLRESVSVLDFGADPTGVADSTDEIQAALTTGQSVFFPDGTYKVTGTLTYNSYVFGNNPRNVVINYTGTGYCFAHTANDGQTDLGISGLQINVSGVGASGIGLGDTAASLGSYYLRAHYSNLYIYGDGSEGSIGMAIVQGAAGSYMDIMCQNFDYGFVFDRTTANQMRRLRAQTFNFGFTWTGRTTPTACGQDSIQFLDILGPSGAKSTGYGLLMDAPQNWSSNVYYECAAASTVKTNLWVTANGSFYKEFASTYSANSNITNPVLLDVSASEVCFVGTHMLADSSTKASVGAPAGALAGFNGTHQLVACGTQFIDIFSTTTIGYISAAGSGKFQPPGLIGSPAYPYQITASALALPPQIYTGGNGSFMSASATVNDATAGKISAGSGAGTSPPTPVVASGSNDLRGTVTFGTGTAASGSTVLNVNFNQTMSTKPSVVISVNTGTGTAVGFVVGAVGTTGFTVSALSTIASSQANTAYSISYIVIG